MVEETPPAIGSGSLVVLKTCKHHLLISSYPVQLLAGSDNKLEKGFLRETLTYKFLPSFLLVK